MAEEKKPAAQKAAAKPAKKDAKKKGGFRQWCHDMKGEMKKIVWPTKEVTMKNTGIVIGMCACVGLFLWVFDFAAFQIVQTLISVLG